MTETSVMGPIEGSKPPWGSPDDEVIDAGYVIEEYQIGGVVQAYRNAGDVDPSGRWEVEPIGEGDYRTRILVVRPSDPDAFSGTVFLNWNNVSAGFEGGAPRGGELYDAGHAWVGVSAQEVGLYGLPIGMGHRGPAGGQPLVDHDTERYGDLFHPGEPACFGMFTQAAQVVGPHRLSAVDPMGGHRVERVIATGGSQSAMKLVAYFNAVHSIEPVVDGALLSVWEGRAPRLEEGPVGYGGWRTRIRDDLDIPIVVVNSEFEAQPVAVVGAGDLDNLRIWEVAGTPHGVNRRGPRKPDHNGRIANRLSYLPVYEAAMSHLDRWVRGGNPAPAQPRIDMEPGRPPRIRRDSLGNAVGGIRLPEIAAPTAEYRGAGFGTGSLPLFGGARPFSDEQVKALYSSRADYLEHWNAAVDELVATEAIRPRDAAPMRARGEEVELPFE
jgi:hypothetical protein